MKSVLPDVRFYSDYRKFLKDCYDASKSFNPKFSHRYFCKKAGYSSSSTFADVLKGRRTLTETGALRLGKAFDLSKEAQEYFLHLIHFNQAESLEAKNLHYEKMLTLGRIKLDTLSRDKYEYFSKWYHAAVRELLYFFPFKNDYKALGRKLNPALSGPLVKKAIQLLEKLGMIQKDKEGYYVQTATLITSDDLGASLHVANFQVATMKLGIESHERHPKEDRDISTLTATLSAESVEQAKSVLRNARQAILTLAERDQKVDRVMQLNIQMFPLTRF